jgi:hypothetical protein
MEGGFYKNRKGGYLKIQDLKSSRMVKQSTLASLAAWRAKKGSHAKAPWRKEIRWALKTPAVVTAGVLKTISIFAFHSS